MLHLFFFLLGLSVAAAQNVAMTSTGIAVAAMGPGRGGLIFQQSAVGQPATQPLPTGIASFEDVSIDAENDALVFALSTVSRRACSFSISDEGLNLVNCVGEGDDFRVSPFCGISALGGTLIISGGTGGLTVYQYDAVSGMISESPSVLNLDLGVIGHPDVVLVNANLAALSTDFSSSPRFGTQMASIEGDSVTFVRDFRVQESLGFSSNISPANFPLVNAIYTTGSDSYMYTANGSLQIQDPLSNNEVATLSLSGAPNGFSAVTVAVNNAQKFLLFGGLTASGGSAILIYDLSVNPRNPSLMETILLAGQRITSIASGDSVAAFTTQGDDDSIHYERLPIRDVPSEGPTSISNEGEDESTSAAFCFSGDNLIKTSNGNYKLMRDIVLGDYVQIPSPSNGKEEEEYSRVYSMGHLDRVGMTKYLQLYYNNNNKPLEITNQHLLFVEGEPKAIAASRVMIGDELVLSSGNTVMVTEIRTVLRKGAYAPLTEAGTMIVSNVSVSCYPTLVENESILDIHTLSHLAVGWRRWLCSCSYFLGRCNNETYTHQGIAKWAHNMMLITSWFVVPMMSSS